MLFNFQFNKKEDLSGLNVQQTLRHFMEYEKGPVSKRSGYHISILNSIAKANNFLLKYTYRMQ